MVSLYWIHWTDYGSWPIDKNRIRGIRVSVSVMGLGFDECTRIDPDIIPLSSRWNRTGYVDPMLDNILAIQRVRISFLWFCLMKVCQSGNNNNPTFLIILIGGRCLVCFSFSLQNITVTLLLLMMIIIFLCSPSPGVHRLSISITRNMLTLRGWCWTEDEQDNIML